MTRREFLLASAAAVAVAALPLSVKAERMTCLGRPCWFDRGDEYGNSVCSTCGASSSDVGIRGLSCALQVRGDWRIQVDSDGYMHHRDITGPYVTRADFRDA